MKRLPPTPPTEQGFSLLEPLVAILILAAVMSALTPPMVLAIATRVRTFRVEQAIRVAQSEVDRNRRLIERETTPASLNSKLPPAVSANATAPEDVGAPTSTTSSCVYPAQVPTTPQGWCRVRDPDNPTDLTKTVLGIQVFRTQVFNLDGSAGSNNSKLPVSYRLGVRVYPIQALQQNAGSLQTKTSALTLSPGSQSLRAPLAVLYAPIARSDFSTTNESALRNLCRLNNDNPGSVANCPEN
ncbi:prepilin-type N-terminal cleavage/methylation domain-containing protein [Trichothermofontia sp.]